MQKLLLAAVLLGQGEPDREETDASLFRMPSLFSWGAPPRFQLSGEMVTDRPDFTESPATVGPGVVQWETGVTVRFRRLGPGEHLHRWDWGESLLRLGLGPPWLEGRLALPLAGQVRHGGFGRRRQQGWEDATVGFKLALAQQQHAWPQLAAVVQTTLPSGNRAFSARAWQPGMMLIAGWELDSRWSTAASAQLHFLRGEEDRLLLQTALSWTLSRQITTGWAAYAEWFSLLHSGPGAGNEHFLNAGLTWLLSPDCQWDIRFGRGLHRGEEWFAGTGLSFRWP